MSEPASIRYLNPGAMWGRTGPRPPGGPVVATNAPLPKKWGSTQTVYLNDGKGQGNNIAVFPTFVQGICAQLDLWRTKPAYRNQKFKNAIVVWSGGNNVPSYIAYVMARVPGMTPDTVMNDAFWKGPMGIGFLRAQAGHEAGKQYPAPAEDWMEAQRRVFEVAAKEASTAKKQAGGVVAGGVVATTVAQHFDVSTPIIIAMVLVVAAVAIAIWRSKK